MNNIILIGYMGAGKTTIGKRLSYRMRKAFIDTDSYIERTNGMEVRDIFSTMGEQAFRDMETEYLKKLLSDSSSVILSTGGGLPMREENRELLKQLGFVVFLRNKPQTAYERLKNDLTRPLLKSDDPLKHITEMMADRHERYVMASDLIIDTDELSFDEIMQRIEDGANEYFGN